LVTWVGALRQGVESCWTDRSPQPRQRGVEGLAVYGNVSTSIRQRRRPYVVADLLDRQRAAMSVSRGSQTRKQIAKCWSFH